MKKNIVIVSFIWILLICISFISNYINAAKEQRTISLQTARSLFEQIVISRTWNAGHGGVYVPVTSTTQPNPYLDDPLRDIKVNDKLTLTKVNPAFMTRQIGEIASKQDGIRFHITSLKTIRPENGPTPREAKTLKLFEKGIQEIGEFIHEDSSDSFFYMAPLATKNECLKCHVEHGYKEGDIRGGISVILPFIPKIPVMVLTAAHVAIGLIGLIGIIISGKKLGNAYDTIKRQAAYDALTEIHNRRSFTEHLLREFGRSQRDDYPLSVIMCDIDHFKLYNDTYGHLKGDECLKTVAKIIEKTLHRPGDFLARYGGEEFVIILPNTTLEGALELAEKIKTNIQEMKLEHIKSPPLNIVTLSLGIASSETKTLSSDEELVNNADKALYLAKGKGRNRVEAFVDTA